MALSDTKYHYQVMNPNFLMVDFLEEKELLSNPLGKVIFTPKSHGFPIVDQESRYFYGLRSSFFAKCLNIYEQ